MALGIDILDAPVLVFGLGKSGLAAALALKGLGARVTVTDKREASQLAPYAADLAAAGIPLAAGGHPEALAADAALVVVSPGVPSTLPLLKALQARGVPRISELELAWRLSRSPWAAITGTNGKTTTTSLVAELFEAAGRPCLLGGNIGVALADKTAGLDPGTAVVAEVSSFQLEDMPSFRPRAAVVTNITPDHLDRYPDMRGYVEAKARILANQGAGDALILNDADPYTDELAARSRGSVLRFAKTGEVEQGAFVRDGRVVLRMPGGGEQVLLPAAEIGIRGPHNLENALAALLTGAAMGLDPAPMQDALRAFRGVEHRLEDCGAVKGVHFVNDSKGTNVDSVEKALQSFNEPIHLILGGRDKHGDFTALAGLIRERVARVLLIGEASDVIEPQVRGLKPVQRVRDMADAVRSGYAGAAAGDWVLLSPGCASFDMFDNYEHRGRVFKQEVARLREEQG